MALTKGNTVITHTEIICLAIQALDAKIEEWHQKCPPTPEGDKFFEEATRDLDEKRETLKVLYKIETGTDYK